MYYLLVSFVIHHGIIVSYRIPVGGPIIDGNPNDAEAVEWDADVQEKLSVHGISESDVSEVLNDKEFWIPNKKAHGANRWKTVGVTNRGTVFTIVFFYDSNRKSLRPITGWQSTTGEKTKYLKKEN
jgi:uncharacterized DUF497 family protein